MESFRRCGSPDSSLKAGLSVVHGRQSCKRNLLSVVTCETIPQTSSLHDSFHDNSSDIDPIHRCASLRHVLTWQTCRGAYHHGCSAAVYGGCLEVQLCSLRLFLKPQLLVTELR